MRRYKLVALGGTFNILHKGHKALIERAFEISDKVLIGITSDEFAKELGKELMNPYPVRAKKVKEFLEEKFPKREYVIFKLNDHFGQALDNENLEALVVSEETKPNWELLNKLREERGLKPVEGIIVEMVKAEDGSRISSSRIKKGEIDEEGKLLKQNNF
ncbi:MAG: phosphopantetheine adenylyltransferase [Nitrososphaerales archaeon]